MIELQEHLEKFGMKSCPIDNSLKILRQKYALHIIRNMIILKQNRFGQFLRSIEGINTKTLSVRLREMEDSGLINRTMIPTRPERIEYSLTEKGNALEPLLVHMAIFSARNKPKNVFKDGRPRITIKQIFRANRLSAIYE